MTGFHGAVSEQGILCRDRAWPRLKDPCCNRVGQSMKKLCHDRAFYVATEFWPRLEGFLSRQNIFMSQQSLAKTKGFHFPTKYFVSRQGVAKTKGPCVATKQFVS